MLTLSRRTLLAALLMTSSAVSATSPQAAATVSPDSASPPQIVGSDQQQAPAIVTIASDNSPPAASAPASGSAGASDRPSYELPPAISRQTTHDQVGGESRPSALSNPWLGPVGADQSQARSRRQREEDASPDRPPLTASSPSPNETPPPAERPSALSPARVVAVSPAASHVFSPGERALPTIAVDSFRPVVTVTPIPIRTAFVQNRISTPFLTVRAVVLELPRVPVSMPWFYVHPTIEHLVFQPAVQAIAAVPQPLPIVASIPPVPQVTGRDMTRVALLPAQPVVQNAHYRVTNTIRALELSQPISPDLPVLIVSKPKASSTAEGRVIVAISPQHSENAKAKPRLGDHLQRKPPTELAVLAKQLHQLNRRLADARHEVQDLKTQVAAQASLSARFAVRLAEKDKEIADLEEQLRVLHASS